MNLLQALLYFVREAFGTVTGNWRASLVAVLTCALSLYIGAFFFLVTGNISRQTESWEGALKISVYLQENISPDVKENLLTLLTEPLWVTDAVFVSQEQARSRFEAAFPEVAGALGSTAELDLPTSLEGQLNLSEIDEAAWQAWIATLAAAEGVASVDDDRSWVHEVQNVALWVRTAGLGISLTLLIAAAFTIAAVVRLTAFQYLDEISVLRLVGATEFFVRGPFVVEGLLQGFAGGLLAILGLWATHLAAAHEAVNSLWTTVLFDRFLSASSQAAIVLIGTLAGLLGSVLSIRRESLEVLDER